MTVFTERARLHFAAQVMDDEMQAVADAEHGHAHVEYAGVGGWRIRVIDRRRPAGENDTERLVGLDFSEGCRAGEHYGEDVLLAYAPGDELGILRAKIENNDCLGVHPLVWQGWGRDVKTRLFDNTNRL